MGWYSIREYTEQMGVSMSTVRRQIQEGRLFAKKFGRHWYIQPPDGAQPPPSPEPKFEEAITDLTSATHAGEGGGLQSVVDFSSKALHHYLIMSEKLIAEKDERLKEKDLQLCAAKQTAAELEGYVKILEEELERQRNKPEGWR